jgi:hypothetical protein
VPALADRLLALYHLLLLDEAQGYIVIAVDVEGGRVGNRALHNPSLEFVLGADEILDLGFGGSMASSELGLPVLVGAGIAPAQNAL